MPATLPDTPTVLDRARALADVDALIAELLIPYPASMRQAYRERWERAKAALGEGE